jgi:hypothetical protein
MGTADGKVGGRFSPGFACSAVASSRHDLHEVKSQFVQVMESAMAAANKTDLAAFAINPSERRGSINDMTTMVLDTNIRNVK